jgi:predicted ABC-type ATPase
MQSAGYFVLLLFVGLSDAQLSVGRVLTRVSLGGHAVESGRLIDRFPRTQKAIAAALGVADAAILTDNSREPALAFTVCRVQMRHAALYDIRDDSHPLPAEIGAWLKIVSPRPP